MNYISLVIFARIVLLRKSLTSDCLIVHDADCNARAGIHQPVDCSRDSKSSGSEPCYWNVNFYHLFLSVSSIELELGDPSGYLKVVIQSLADR
jgi:hypothetical protein